MVAIISPLVEWVLILIFPCQVTRSAHLLHIASNNHAYVQSDQVSSSSYARMGSLERTQVSQSNGNGDASPSSSCRE